jgi:hypothetical protein
MSQRQVYYIAIVASVLCTVGIFFYGVHINSKDDAVRGGAFPLLVSFLLLFLRRNYGEQSFQALGKAYPDITSKLSAAPKSLTSDETTTLVLALLSRINIEADERKMQDIALFIASVIGTITLAFGDFFFKLIKS